MLDQEPVQKKEVTHKIQLQKSVIIMLVVLVILLIFNSVTGLFVDIGTMNKL